MNNQNNGVGQGIKVKVVWSSDAKNEKGTHKMDLSLGPESRHLVVLIATICRMI
jgi:hypothetical protein